jgi:anti-anti-sigma factor
MQIEETKSGAVLILRPQGRLDAVSAPSLQENALGHISAGVTSLVLDLEKVDYVSSAGLRAVLVAAKRLREIGGRVVVCSLHGIVLEVFGMSGFDQIIETAPDQATALATFS